MKKDKSHIEKVPDAEVIKKLLPLAEFLKNYHHYRVDGMSKIPKEGKGIILVNHSLATYDILLLGYMIYTKLQRLPRALADRQFYKNDITANFMHKIGVHEAGHDNAQELLEKGELLILAPGGMKESIRSSEEKFQIKWDDRTGFARLAIRTQAPIILAACPGADNMYEVKASPITDFAYKYLKLPVTFAKGFRNTILPKPTKLVHYIHEPILPPVFEGEGEPPVEMVKAFHDKVIRAMEKLIQDNLTIYLKK